MDISVIILAAGKGKRFKSDIPKVLHKIMGRTMVEVVIGVVKRIENLNQIYVVVGHGKEMVIEKIKNSFQDIIFVEQKEQKGTGHAVMCCEDKLKNYNDDILILCGDMPLVKSETLKKFISYYKEKKADICVLSTIFDNPTGYGRIVRKDGKFFKIIEETDATYEIKQIKEINTGIYCVKSKILFNLLRFLSNNNAQGEYYLTDIIEKAVNKNLVVDVYCEEDNTQFLGINTRVQLAEAENILLKRKIENLMLNGVTFIKPETTFIGLDVNIEKDCIIYPGNFITGKTIIMNNSIIGQNNFIKDSFISKNAVIKGFCYIENAKIDSNTQIGPFSHLRPNSIIGKNCKVGNFVEIKKSELKDGVKASHLSYIGDAFIDENTNIGAGTITCNYDGVKKHKTIIGKNVFIGSDTQLVAPVNVGDYTLIAAGTTLTKDVGENMLVHSRVKQQEIKGKGMKSRIGEK